jgi:3-hydroxybutyryl-CoA dehydratase
MQKACLSGRSRHGAMNWVKLHGFEFQEIPDMPTISNHTYDEITIGQSATYSKLIEARDIQLFAALSGDVNPVHLDAEFAASTQFKGCIAHGMLSGAIISAAIAMELPGPGTIYLGQTLRFCLPVRPNDTITVHLKVTEKKDKRRMVTLDCTVFNQLEKLVLTGTAEVMAPQEKLIVERPEVPHVRIEN